MRAAHDRSLDSDNAHLWQFMSAQPIQFYQEVELPATAKRSDRTTNLAVRFCRIQLRSPRRLHNQDPIDVYTVYAQEIDPPEGEEAVSWMLLTTELVTTAAEAATILRWYTYRWHVEEDHKILKSGCKAESYRFAATSMEAMLGFLTVIAAEKSAHYLYASHSTRCPSDNSLIRACNSPDQEFRTCVLTFYNACTEVVSKILQAFALTLQLPEDFFAVRHDQRNHTLRLLHYPPLQQLPKLGQVRAGEHSDYGSITLLFQDQVGGLEVQTTAGEWIPSSSIPGTVVVNTGDLMQRWTNDVFCSNLASGDYSHG